MWWFPVSNLMNLKLSLQQTFNRVTHMQWYQPWHINCWWFSVYVWGWTHSPMGHQWMLVLNQDQISPIMDKVVHNRLKRTHSKCYNPVPITVLAVKYRVKKCFIAKWLCNFVFHHTINKINPNIQFLCCENVNLLPYKD